MRKNDGGSSLFQYVVIIGLISLALSPVFFILGQKIYQYFDNFYQDMSSNNEIMKENLTNSSITSPSNQSTSSTDLPSTSNNSASPTKQCTDGSCTITFGDFILTGIPDNFGDLVNKNGSSRGTETLVAIFEQMAEQAENNNLIADSTLLKKLANAGHVIAGTEKSIETSAQIIYDSQTTLPDATTTPDTTSQTNLPDGISAFETILSEFNSSETNENTKKLANVLSDEILSLANNILSTQDSFVQATGNQMQTLEAILHPNASAITDMDSAIICVAGENTDSGTVCN